MDAAKIARIMRDVPTPVWVALIAAGAVIWWRSRPDDAADDRGPVDRVTDAIFPPGKCAAAMNAGDIPGAAWHCRPATFAAWVMGGRPKNCSVMEDGKISCPAPTKGPKANKPAAPVGGGGIFKGGGASGSW